LSARAGFTRPVSAERHTGGWADYCLRWLVSDFLVNHVDFVRSRNPALPGLPADNDRARLARPRAGLNGLQFGQQLQISVVKVVWPKAPAWPCPSGPSERRNRPEPCLGGFGGRAGRCMRGRPPHLLATTVHHGHRRRAYATLQSCADALAALEGRGNHSRHVRPLRQFPAR